MFDQKTKPGPLGTDRQCVHACRSVRAHISETLFRFLFLPSFEDIQQCIAAFLSILFIGFCRVHWQLQSNLSRCNDHKTLCCFLAIGNNAAFREVLGFASQHQLQCSRKSSHISFISLILLIRYFKAFLSYLSNAFNSFLRRSAVIYLVSSVIIFVLISIFL